MADIELAAVVLDAIAGDRCDLLQIGSEFEGHDSNPGGEIARAVAAALLLRFIEGDAESRSAYGPYAGPLGQREAPNLTTVATWEALVASVDSPAVRGRLHDLLWIAKSGESPWQHAREAVHSYVTAAKVASSDGFDQAILLERALELARQISANGLLGGIGQGASVALAQELERSDAAERPGVSLRLFHLITSLPDEHRPTDLHARLDDLATILDGSHPSIREMVVELRQVLARGDKDEVARLQRARAQLWIDWALQHESGLARRGMLSTALERAGSAPDSGELRRDIRRHMQAIGPDEVDLQTISVATEIPAPQIESFIGSIVGDNGIESALMRFGFWGPPTGDPAANAKAVNETMSRSLVWQLLSVSAIDGQGRPVRDFVSEEDRRDAAMIEQETFGAGIHGALATLVLDRMGEQFAPPSEQLTALFETRFITSEQADAFSRAFAHYWSGRHDESIHIALPRVEAVLRRMLVSAGGIAYTEPQGGRPGQEKTLGTVLSELRPALPDEGWRRSMLVLLTEPTSFNIRNKYLHGLVSQTEKLETALTLQIAAYLRLLGPRDSAGRT